MEFERLAREYSKSEDKRRMAIFASIFIQQNKLQTACDKLDAEITMKQWLLLAMAGTSKEPKTLTQLGELMGCSRQNVKKLALSLEKKGFLKVEQNPADSRAVCLLLDEKMKAYTGRVGVQQMKVLELLFADFSDEELCQLYDGVMKLYHGLERVETYVE